MRYAHYKRLPAKVMGLVTIMLLAADIGNTQTVVGVYQGSDLACMWRLATNPATTADEVRVMLLPLFESAGLALSDVDRAALASVVPQLTGAWCRAIRDGAGAKTMYN